MTGDAITVNAATQGFGIRRAFLIGSGLMLVVMVPEVLCSRSGLVLAIAGHRRPSELERQEKEKKDRKPAAHGPDCISENHFQVHRRMRIPFLSQSHFRESVLFD